VYRHAARQQLTAVAAVYFRFFAPPTEWSFEGAGVRVAGSDLDLVFRSPSAAIRADELKTGLLGSVDRAALDAQLAAQLDGGTARYGAHFFGVRVLFLRAPKSSFVASRDGSREPLFRGVK
jgi:hypothetical protein